MNKSKWLSRGFTLVELLIVMAVVAILVAIIIPSFKGMQEEGWISKAEQELQTLQTAVESYYRHKDDYPPNITTALTGAKPAIISKELKDPWDTSGTTYGYVTGNDDTGFGKYYIIYSRSVDRVTNIVLTPSDNCLVDGKVGITSNDTVSADAADDLAVSNAPLDF
ncbi:MAG: type II secretion system protein [Candidatus Margulisiibacteriota bacterium]